jgi:hypothetical protein
MVIATKAEIQSSAAYRLPRLPETPATARPASMVVQRRRRGDEGSCGVLSQIALQHHATVLRAGAEPCQCHAVVLY